ncbi:MAG: SpoIIE family protein phosphatase [Deltaproteobacteria bacterium]|jgi:sigma-B regulation protein RsbU (phosphoserine phosphatase)|nr:SpoIIE family protein phosphatase [Deltaproteobacteria bacterium]
MESKIIKKFSDICNSNALGAAFQAQSELFERFISMARSPDEPEVVKVMLQKTIDISIALTGADHGSLILLDSDGSVVDSILSRGDISENFKSSLIESAFQEGLAGWVRRHQKIGLVNDTNKDDRWLTFPNQPYSARSALALPIISGEVLLGILTLKHSMPHHFTEEIAELMRITATQMAMVLENACLFSNLSDSLQSLGKANQTIEAYSRVLDKELENCRQIQKSFLPSQLPELFGWDIEEFFFPARHVSGDFYDAFMLPGGYAGLVIGDVCDKGVGSALFMALYRSLIRVFSGQAQLNRSLINTQSQTVGGAFDSASIRQQNQVEAIRTVALTNEYIAQDNEMCMFATLFFGVLDPENGKLIYINGGHETVYVIDQNGIKERLLTTGPAVGLIPHAQFEYKEIYLNPGEILFAYTDGVTDARSPNDERFTRKRLFSLLSQPVATALDLIQRIGTNLFAHIGKAPQEDDITMLTIQRHNSNVSCEKIKTS